ncbi:MAG: zinc ribbon domain-containing protein [Phycisphaerales bacterium]|nr:zinc ribbon domain-containing protein [Phycisphaerales bacterium]
MGGRAVPVYEYRCRSCDAAFEQLVLSPESERELRCPSCGATGPIRQLSTFAARSTAGRPAIPSATTGGCGRCGDPSGPCSMN